LLPLTDEWRNTIYKSDVNCELGDGDAILVGPYKLRITHVPGHTPGSIAIWTQMDGRWILFGGDSILFNGRLGAQMLPHSDNIAYVASLAKMQQLRDDDGQLILWDMLMPAHGTLSLDRGYKDVDEAWETARLTLDQGKAIAALPFASERFRYQMFGRPLLEARPQ
jgi:glyoxylase-like metal-dependent hydrolase (beta-lactamase superfamily II)